MNLKAVLEKNNIERLLAIFLVALVIVISLVALKVLVIPGSEVRFAEEIDENVINTFRKYNEQLESTHVLISQNGISLEVQWLDDKYNPSHIIYLTPEKYTGEFNFELNSEKDFELPEKYHADIMRDVLVLAKSGLWEIYTPLFNGQPAFNKLLGQKMLFGVSFLWFAVFLCGVLIILLYRWKWKDLIILFPLIFYIILALTIRSLPLDIKLHFLTSEFEIINLVDIYGFGSAAFKLFVAHFLGPSPEVLYIVLKLFGFLSLLLLYIVCLYFGQSRLYAVLAVTVLATSPLVIKVFFSDSCHVVAFFSLLVSLALLADRSSVMTTLRLVLSAVALVLAASVRFELFPILLVPLIALIFFGKNRVLLYRTSFFTKFLAIVPSVILLTLNYLFVLTNLGSQADGFFNPTKTLFAITGMSSDNLFFNKYYNSIEYMIWAKMGFLLLFFVRRKMFAIVLFVFGSLFFLHNFTVAPIYQSVHYQFFGWLPEYFLAAFAVYYILQIILDRLKGDRYLWLCAIMFFGIAVFSGYKNYWLLGDEPVTYHSEYILLSEHHEEFKSAKRFYNWNVNFDCCLSNPGRLLKAYGYSNVENKRISPRDTEPFAGAEEGDLYYRGIICYMDDDIYAIFKEFEQSWEMDVVELKRVKGIPFLYYKYASDNAEIGLFRLKKKKQ